MESVREIESQASSGAEQIPEEPNAPPPAAQVDPRAFRDGYEPKPSDVFIAIMGVTGAGKSTFISKCTEKEVRIGHNLQACKTTLLGLQRRDHAKLIAEKARKKSPSSSAS